MVGNTLVDNPQSRELMEHLNRAGTSMALAILADQFIFEMLPKIMKYSHETTMNFIDEYDDNILATGKAYDKMQQGNARLIKPILDKVDLLSLIGVA